MEESRKGFCICVFIVCIELRTCGSAVKAGHTLSLGESMTRNQTIISRNGTFELGFFSPDGTSNWYIGIWYANITEKTIVWVANRETPARESPGVLKLSGGGDLGLFDATGASLWSAKVTKKPSQAVLLDSGNFVMFGDANKSETVWQSFDYPVDTLLSGVRFGGQQKLVSWKSSVDPAPGIFSYQMDPSGAEQTVLIWNKSVQYSASGNWDGKSFTGIPRMVNQVFFYNVDIESTNSGWYVTVTLNGTKNVLSRFVLTKSGEMQSYGLLDDGKWSMFWSRPADSCSVYGLCGAYGICNSNNVQFCSCVEGFAPADTRAWDSREAWSSGCVRQSPLNCDAKNGSTDGFVELINNLADDKSASSYPDATTKKDCQKACLLNCSCTAFAFNPPSGPCQIWSGDILNTRSSLPTKNNSNVFIRVAASPLSKTEKSSSFKYMTPIVVGALVVALGIISLLVWRRHRQRQWPRSMESVADSTNSFLRMFSYMELKIATRNFRSKLGSGGFGMVYKGRLVDGTPVAVKKMNGVQRQDEKQFRAEISSLGNIQHANLVRLRGFCAESSRRFLVYDFMPNGSLNSLLFFNKSEGKQKVLNWKTRFEIALGTARGLLYLHEECRDCIIHCDVKPENILLDNDFSPKLADFGLAKLVGRDFSRVLTTTRGTRGYLAPEWISGIPITPKVDMYSFGMTLLEIISGRRNLDLSVQDSSKYYFPTWAVTQIYSGNTINVVEEGIAEERDIEEVRRASIVALLCIEKDERVRPSMGQVVLTLEGKTQPQIPQIQCSVPIDEQVDQSNTGSSE